MPPLVGSPHLPRVTPTAQEIPRALETAPGCQGTETNIYFSRLGGSEHTLRCHQLSWLTQAGNMSLRSSEGQGQQGRTAQTPQLELLP